MQLLKLAGLADFVDDSGRGLGDKTPVECCAVEVSVWALDEPASGIVPIPVSRGSSATDEGMEQRELPLRSDLENRALTALCTPVAVVAAVKSRAVEVAVGRLEKRRHRSGSVRAVEGVHMVIVGVNAWPGSAAADNTTRQIPTCRNHFMPKRSSLFLH